MTRVSVVGTVHDENGHTTVSSLLAILGRIKPEVIFLEIPSAAFHDYFEGNRSNLESAAAHRYRADHAVELVPVDLPTPGVDFFTNTEHLFRRIEKVSPDYRRLVDRHRQYVAEYGFAYLNSEHCNDLWLQIDQAVRSAVDMLADRKLNDFYESWRRTNKLRDNGMMDNIEKHCRQATFESAAFLVGAAHRKSIIDLSRSAVRSEPSTVLWDFAAFLEVMKDSDTHGDNSNTE